MNYNVVIPLILISGICLSFLVFIFRKKTSYIFAILIGVICIIFAILMAILLGINADNNIDISDFQKYIAIFLLLLGVGIISIFIIKLLKK